MKTTGFFLLLLVLNGFAALAAEPFMALTEETEKRNGVDVQVKSWKIRLPHGGMNFKNTITADGKLITGKWGDFFFGLGHGPVIGWSPWSFLSVQDTQKQNPITEAPVDCITLCKFNEGAYAKFTWGSGYVKVLQLYDNKDWTFVKVCFPKGLKSVSIHCYPGGSDWVAPGRERRVRLGEDDRELGKDVQTLPFRDNTSGLALYNRNYKETYGNFLVFEPFKMSSVEGASVNAVTLTFNVKPGVTSAIFALGFFANEDPMAAVPRFLVERLSNVRKSLYRAPWDPMVNFSDFLFNRDQVRWLIEGLGEQRRTIRGLELDKISADFEKAEKARDVDGCAKAMDSLRELQKNVGLEGLAALK